MYYGPSTIDQFSDICPLFPFPNVTPLLQQNIKRQHMKVLITSLVLLISSTITAQSLIPSKNVFESKWIKNVNYQMGWYVMRDTTKMKIADVHTSIKTDKNYITIITEVKMLNTTAQWIDTTIAELKTLKPIRHSSFNAQRDMNIVFGKVVSGYYHDKLKKEITVISDTTTTLYFDSNIYPTLINWLPLKEGYQQEISIYDYNPAVNGVIGAGIKNVQSGSFNTDAGVKDVWIVTVKDDIAKGANDHFVYYIDKQDRRLWMQEINAGGRKMRMERNEK